MLKTSVWSTDYCVCSRCWSLNSGFLGWIIRGGEWKVSGQVYSGGQDQVQPDKYTEALPRYLCAGGQAGSPTLKAGRMHVVCDQIPLQNANQCMKIYTIVLINYWNQILALCNWRKKISKNALIKKVCRKVEDICMITMAL